MIFLWPPIFQYSHSLVLGDAHFMTRVILESINEFFATCFGVILFFVFVRMFFDVYKDQCMLSE